MNANRPARSSPQPMPSQRVGQLVVRGILALGCLGVLAAPFVVAFELHYRSYWIGPQHDTPPAQVAGAKVARDKSASRQVSAGSGTAPVILAYHDIAPDSTSSLVVSPAAFEAQMAALTTAGYHSLTSTQLLHYLRGGTVPTHSVAITFDDGTRGLWTYADKILARHHLTAISFLITGRVDTHQPYYLTWPQIQRMYGSGRWDFESHTHDLHAQILVGPHGARGSALVHRRWLGSPPQQESMSSARDRIRTDLARSITDLTSRGLPRPRLFAYPLSEAEDHGDDATQHFVTDLVHRTFTAAMLNLPPAAPLSRREAATGLLHRLEVTAADTPDTVLDNLLPLANLATADVSGLADRRSWIGSDGLPAQVSISRGTVTFDHGGTYAYAAYAPAVTADWTGYTASVRVSGLEPRPGSAVSGALSVRVGSAAELRVNVSGRFVQIHTGNAGKPVPVVARSLPAAPHHLITVHAGADTTKVSVDGKVVYQGPVSATPSSGGGFALSASRAKPDAPFAEFAALAVRPDR